MQLDFNLTRRNIQRITMNYVEVVFQIQILRSSSEPAQYLISLDEWELLLVAFSVSQSNIESLSEPLASSLTGAYCAPAFFFTGLHW